MPKVIYCWFFWYLFVLLVIEQAEEVTHKSRLFLFLLRHSSPLPHPLSLHKFLFVLVSSSKRRSTSFTTVLSSSLRSLGEKGHTLTQFIFHEISGRHVTLLFLLLRWWITLLRSSTLELSQKVSFIFSKVVQLDSFVLKILINIFEFVKINKNG